MIERSRQGRCATLAWVLSLAPGAAGAQVPPSWSVYISADMEGLTGVGAPAMTSSGGKDYSVGRRMMTRDLNAVIAGIRAAADERGIDAVRIVVNDSHGDHANALIEELAPGVEYVQGSLKPLGMVAELDETFDAAMYVGYHARAGTMGFLAHTGSGSVRELRINGIPSGEGEMNAAFAGAHGVPVVLVHGDRHYVEQARETYAANARGVISKTAVTARAARLRPVADVQAELTREARAAMLGLADAEPWAIGAPYVVHITLSSTTLMDVAENLFGVERVDPLTVRFETDDIRRAYAMIRLLYRFLSV